MYKVYLANAAPADVARIGQNSGLSGSVSSVLGFGEWGIEPTTVVESGTADILDIIPALFISYPNEKAVYVVRNGVGSTEYR